MSVAKCSDCDNALLDETEQLNEVCNSCVKAFEDFELALNEIQKVS